MSLSPNNSGCLCDHEGFLLMKLDVTTECLILDQGFFSCSFPFPYPKVQSADTEVLNTVVVGGRPPLLSLCLLLEIMCHSGPLVFRLSLVAQGVSLSVGKSTHCSQAFIWSLLGTVFSPSSETQLLILCVMSSPNFSIFQLPLLCRELSSKNSDIHSDIRLGVWLTVCSCVAPWCGLLSDKSSHNHFQPNWPTWPTSTWGFLH